MSLSCDVVMDLVSIYKDGLASQDTARLVKEHLRHCPDCRKYYRQYDAVNRMAPQKQDGCAAGDYMNQYQELSAALKRRRNFIAAGLALFTAASCLSISISLYKLKQMS